MSSTALLLFIALATVASGDDDFFLSDFGAANFSNSGPNSAYSGPNSAYVAPPHFPNFGPANFPTNQTAGALPPRPIPTNQTAGALPPRPIPNVPQFLPPSPLSPSPSPPLPAKESGSCQKTPRNTLRNILNIFRQLENSGAFGSQNPPPPPSQGSGSCHETPRNSLKNILEIARLFKKSGRCKAVKDKSGGGHGQHADPFLQKLLIIFCQLLAEHHANRSNVPDKTPMGTTPPAPNSSPRGGGGGGAAAAAA